MDLYPGATWRPSVINHPLRQVTNGITIHNTYGHLEGDIATLDGPSVDCHFYVTQAGKIWQFLDPDSMSWTAMHTANSTCLHIEHEGSRETPWTPEQARASAGLVAWLCRRYDIPVRHVDPPGEWSGLFDHRDLQGFEGNDHGDGVPPSFPGWPKYLEMVKAEMGPVLPASSTLRLVIEGRQWSGWTQSAGAIKWVAKNGLKPGTRTAMSWKGGTWRGPQKVTNVCKALAAKYLGG